MGIDKKNEKMPLISIVTVVFNSFGLIERTIQSIINQDYSNIDFVVIDGGSTDGTLGIIEKYRRNINYFKSEPDKGIYDAMNKGLEAATGDYVMFINSGDLLEDNVLSKIFKQYGKEADVLFGETNFMDESGNVIGTRSEISTRKLPKKLTWKSMKFGMVVSHQSFIVRRILAPKYNIQYKCSADIDWVINCLKNSRKIENAETIISRYLIGGFSIKHRNRCFKERYEVYKKHYGMISNWFIHGYIGVRAILHRFFKGKNY